MHAGQRHSGASRAWDHEAQVVGQLKALSWQLDVATRAAVRDSLYRLSRRTHAHGAAEPGSHVRAASTDYVVANLIFSRVQ